MKTMLNFFGALVAVVSLAHAKCGYDFDVSNVTILVGDTAQVLAQPITLTRDGGNSTNCRNYRLFFGKGLANSYQRKAFTWGGRSINYNLHQALNKVGILKDFNDAVTAAEYLAGSAQDRHTTYSTRHFISAPAIDDGFVDAGIYIDVVQVALYSYRDDFSGFDFEGTRSLTIFFTVPEKVQVSLVDENGSFDPSSTNKVLDFGLLEKGETMGVDLRVSSNTPYQVKMSSMNGSSLKSGSTGIAYALKVNGTAVSLGTPGSSVFVGSGNSTNSSGALYNMRITISGETENMPAGIYQDAITITAIAN